MLDRLGITATSLCALHCILLPVILPVLPLLGLSFLADHAWEHVFLIITGILGSIAMLSGFKKYHRRLYPLYLLLIGLTVYWMKHDFSEAVQPFMIAIGASCIVAAHLINIKLCNSCRKCIDDGCSTN